EGGLVSLSRIGFSAPPELEITVRPRSERARLDQTDFDLKLFLPTLDVRLNADDAVRIAGNIKAGVTPSETEQGLSTRITPEVDIALESLRLKSVGIQRLSGNLGWTSGAITIAPQGVEVTG